MAGTKAPDPRTLESWEEAFQRYSVPEVRKIEQKARGSIKENQERLRTLVGTSYRDLLGTARTIIDTSEQMQEVESLLAKIGKQSDSRLVDKTSSNYARLQASCKADKISKFTLASHLSVLQHSLSAVSRLLRSRGSSLLAGKLWILARLAHQFLSSKPNAPLIVHNLGKRLDILRDRLRHHLDHELVISSKDASECAHCLAALSVVTSSTPTDALRYYQRLRLAALKRHSSDAATNVKARILSRLRLFLGTLRDSRSIFPDALGPLLKALGSKPLLDDTALLGTEELNIDVYRHWLADDIKNFRPWTRHDELTKPKAQSMLRSWAGEALGAMIEGIQGDLEQETDVHVILDIRKEVLQEWLSSKSTRFAGITSTGVLDQLRTCFIERIESLIRSAFAGLKDGVCQTIEDILNRWDENSTISGDQHGSIWDPAFLSMDYENGASVFKEAVINEFTGRTERIRHVIASYAQGLERVDSIRNEIQAMKEEHWENADDFDEDYDEIDDDDIEPATVTEVLSKSDPEKLRASMDSSASRDILEMEETMNSLLARSESNFDCSDASARGIFVLRVLREVSKRVSKLSSISALDKNAPLCQEIIGRIHSTLAEGIVEKTEPILIDSLEKFVDSKMIIKSTWDGRDIALPVNPSPAIFKYLRGLSRTMEQLGPDVWSPPAVKSSKRLLSISVRQAMERSIEQLEAAQEVEHAARLPEKGVDSKAIEQEKEEGELSVKDNESDAGENPEESGQSDISHQVDGDVPAKNLAGETNEKAMDMTPDQTLDKLVQLVFDMLYLQHMLGSGGEKDTDWSAMVSKLQQKTELLEAAMVRLRKSAGDYWRRTYLLFGLLCAPGTY